MLYLAPTKTLFLTLPPDGTNKNMQALLVTPEAKEQLDKSFLLFYFLHLLNCGNLITYKRLCEPFFLKKKTSNVIKATKESLNKLGSLKGASTVTQQDGGKVVYQLNGESLNRFKGLACLKGFKQND